MNEAKNVYLLPLFLKNMTYSLKLTVESLCKEMEDHITNELEKAHSDISEKLDHVYPKKMDNKKIIQELDKQHAKVISKTGGKQIKVLFLLRDLLINLDHWEYLSRGDLTRLKKIIASRDLFFSSYKTGIDTKTIGRFLSVDNENLQAHDPKIKLLFEVFKKHLTEQTTRKLYFDLFFSDAASVQSTFFTYMGGDVTFENQDILINTILNLKNLPFEEFFQKLEHICKDLNLIYQVKVFLPVKSLDRPVNEDEKNAAFDAQLEKESYYTDFHTTAMNFLRENMSLRISELDERYAQQDLYSIVDDAWRVFSKMFQEDIAKGTSLKELPFQELVIHSLHNHEKFHFQLCNAFKNWQQGDLL